MRLIFAIFALPFWAFLVAAAGFFVLGEYSYRDTLAKNQEMARALAGAPPDTVSFADFSRQDDVGLADEVSVQAVINPVYNYELTRKRKGSNRTRFMYVLFDPADPEDSKVARGALVLTAAEKDKFVDSYFVENVEISLGASGLISVLTLNGLAQNSSDLSSMVSDAFEEQNLAKSDEFIYIAPFLEGRTVGLTPKISADEMRGTMRGIGIAVAVIGLVKFALRRRKKQQSATPPDVGLAAGDGGFPSDQVKPSGAMSGLSLEAALKEPARSRKPFPIKVLAVLALLGVAIYSGHMAYIAIAVLLALQFLAIRKTRHLITGVLAKVTGRGASDDTKEVTIMANVQEAARDVAMPDAPGPDPLDADGAQPAEAKRRFSLPPLSRRGTSVEVPGEGLMQEAATAEKPKRGLALRIAALRRKSADTDMAKIDTNSAEIPPSEAATADKPKRSFAFSLAALRRKKDEDAVDTQTAAAITKTPRRKEAFQSAALFTSEEADEPQGLGGKIQLLMARLMPAERLPKAFADRPDPFDRLTADVQRASVR